MKSLPASSRLVAMAGIVLSVALSSAHAAVLTAEQPQKLIASQALATTELAQNSSEGSGSQGSSNNEHSNPLGTVLFWIVSVAVIAGMVTFYLKGAVVIGEDEVGIVIKRFNLNPLHSNLSTHQHSNLSTYQPIALNGEPGIQADTLSTGKYWHYPYWMYSILKEPKIYIAPEEIGLVIAKYGDSIPPERRLGRAIECDNFQNARKFLLGDGEKGQQLDILTTGEYQINTKLFTVITTANADQHDADPRNLQICRIPSDMIGIVTTMDGAPIQTDKGEIAGPPIRGNDNLGHDNFQSPQKFIKGGGRRGLQEEVLPSGPWRLNPWFIKVEKVPLTEVPEGTVGVVVSLIGKEAPKKDVDSTHARNSPIEKGYELVEEGYRGVLKEPLSIGKHPINTKVKRVVIVPTHQIILDWSNDKTKAADNYDKKLGVLKPVSVDGFVLDIVVRQSFRVPREKAPEMISQIGSPDDAEPETVASSSGSSSYRRFKPIRDLITRVLGPTVENYFYSAVQDRKALDFHQDRRQQQRAAADRLKAVLNQGCFILIEQLIW